jgi:hypothetical protein
MSNFKKWKNNFDHKVWAYDIEDFERCKSKYLIYKNDPRFSFFCDYWMKNMKRIVEKYPTVKLELPT